MDFNGLDLNTQLLLLTIFTALGSFFVEAMTEQWKNLQQKWQGKSVSGTLNNLEAERALYIMRASRCEHDPSLKEHYEQMGEEVLHRIKLELSHKRPLNWLNIIIPTLFGVILVAVFYPLTVFSFLPFGPSNYYIAATISAVLISRSANGAHGAADKISNIFESLIGRIFPR